MRLSCEMMWREEPLIEEARKLPGWKNFHRVCGEYRLYFDRMRKDGRKWVCEAFTSVGYAQQHLATGTGATVIASVEDAYRKSGRANADTDAAWDALHGVPVNDEWKDVLGL